MSLAPCPSPPAPRSIEWCDEPTAATREDYERLKAGFIRRVAGFAGVRAIFEHRAGAYEPGISDIDLIVVTQGRLGRDAPQRLSLNLDEPRAREIYRGGPVVMPAELFHEPVLTPHWTLRQLWGEPLVRRALEPEEAAIARALVSMEQSGHVLLALARRKRSRRWLVKATLGVLKGLMHNYSGLQQRPDRPEEFARWWQRVEALRRDWFTLGPNRYNELEALTDEAWGWAEETCWLADRWFRLRGSACGSLRHPAVLVGRDRQVVIFTNASQEAADRVAQVQRTFAGCTVIVLPGLYGAQLATAMEVARGAFARLLLQIGGRLQLEGSLTFTGLGAAIVRERIILQQAWYTFFQRHGFARTGCEGAWWVHVKPSRRNHPGHWRLLAGLSDVREDWMNSRVAVQLRERLECTSA